MGSSLIENRFVELYLRSNKLDIREASYASGGQPNINLRTLAPYPIQLPGTHEQAEIVRRIDSLFELEAKVSARVKAVAARVEKITQSILAKAFHGELVPTEAELARLEGSDYEPASALLERIRAEGVLPTRDSPIRRRQREVAEWRS